MTPRSVSLVATVASVLAFAVGASACSGSSPSANLAASDGGTPDDASPSVDAGADAGGCGSDVVARPGTVITASGAVTGVKTDATWSWKGIPYAAPPVGPLRFRPPQPAACWSGERQANAFGAKCPQVDSDTKAVVGSEDCLTLNVWANDGAKNAPVLVYIHGGGNVAGSASDALFDGKALAEQTGAVIVTLEYRLGALGFLATAALSKESSSNASGNYALLDQIAALQWVKANVAGFGGSPEHVMLFGESAGAEDTLALVASPLAKGLFQAAAAESGGTPGVTLADGITKMQGVVDAVGCTGAADEAACLRGKPAEQIAAVPAAIGPLDKGLHYTPVVDGYVLPQSVSETFAAGTHNHVPIIIGTNANETSRMVPDVKTEDDYKAAVQAQYAAIPGAADALLAEYPAASYTSPRAALVALTTDTTWTCPIRKVVRSLAKHQSEPVFRYHFSWKAPGAQGQLVGATHGLELPFVFGTFGAIANGAFKPTAADTALSKAMQGYWSRNAAAGDPNGGSDVAWPRYDAAADPYLELDTTIAAQAGLATAHCDTFDAIVK